MKIKKLLSKVKPIRYYLRGKKFINDPHYIEVQKKTWLEISKSPKRTEIINFLLSIKPGETSYLEIGVHNPEGNFNHIKANKKYSVDPGVELETNPAHFKLTSDVFFQKLSDNEILSNDIRFDVIFIDGSHFAEQVDRDIANALKYSKDDGFIVLHDCNPPTEWHARELYQYHNTPAHGYWNGTTWKAFLKWRFNSSLNSCCIDSDWGVGILSKKYPIGKSIESMNPFFEFTILADNRKLLLNLIDFETFKKKILKT